MRWPSWIAKRLEPYLSIGARADEREAQRGARRVIITAVVCASVLSIPTAITDLSGGLTWIGGTNLVTVAAGFGGLWLIAVRPHLLRP